MQCQLAGLGCMLSSATAVVPRLPMPQSSYRTRQHVSSTHAATAAVFGLTLSREGSQNEWGQRRQVTCLHTQHETAVVPRAVGDENRTYVAGDFSLLASLHL